MKKFKIPPCQNHSLSPRVVKKAYVTTSAFASRIPTCIMSHSHVVIAEGSRSPLPKAGPKHSCLRRAIIVAEWREARGGTFSGAFCQPSEFLAVNGENRDAPGYSVAE